MKRIVRYIKIPVRVVGVFLLILLAAWVLLKVPLINKAILSKAMISISSGNSPFAIEADKFDIDLTGSVLLGDVRIRNKVGDTLFYAQKLILHLNRTELFFSFTPHLEAITLSNAHLSLGKSFKSDSTPATDWIAQIKAYTSYLPRKATIHRLYIDIDQPSVRARAQVLQTTIFLHQEPDTLTDLSQLIQNIEISSPTVQLYRYSLAPQKKQEHQQPQPSSSPFSMSAWMKRIQSSLVHVLDIVEKSSLTAKASILDLDVSDKTTDSLFNIRSLSAFKNIPTYQDGRLLRIHGQMNGVPLQLAFDKRKTTYHLEGNVGRTELKARYHYSIKEQMNQQVALYIEKLRLSSDVAQAFALKGDVKHLWMLQFGVLQGLMTSSKEKLTLRLSSASKFPAERTLQYTSTYHFPSDLLSIDTSFITLSRSNIAILYDAFLKKSYPHFPYRLEAMGKLQLDGFWTQKNNQYKLDAHITEFDLGSSDKNIPSLRIQDVSTRLLKNESSSRLLQATQWIGKIDINERTAFENLRLSYRQKTEDNSEHTFSIATMTPFIEEKKLDISGAWSVRQDDEITASIRGSVFEISEQTIYPLSAPMDSLLVSMRWNTHLKMNRDFFNALGKIEDLRVLNTKNHRAIHRPSATYNIHLDPNGNLYSVKTGESSYELWTSPNASFQHIYQNFITHHKTLLRNPAYVDSMSQQIAYSDQFELSIYSNTLNDLFQMFGYDYSLNDLQLNVKVMPDECGYFLKTEGLKVGNHIQGDLNLRFQTDKTSTFCEFKTNNLDLFPSADYHIKNAYLYVHSIDKINFDMQTQVAFANQRKLEVNAKLIAVDTAWSQLIVNHFFIDVADEGVWTMDKRLGKENLSHDAHFFKQNEQIWLNAKYNRLDETVNVRLNTQGVNVGFLNDLFFKPAFEVNGMADVEIALRDKIYHPSVTTKGLVHHLHFNHAPLGDMHLEQTIKQNTMHLHIYNMTTNPTAFEFQTKMEFGSPRGSLYTIRIETENIPVSWMNNYTEGVMSHIQGFCGGKTTILYEEKTNKLALYGRAFVHAAKFKLKSNNVIYQMGKTEIELMGDEIAIPQFALKDTILPASSLKGNLKLQQRLAFEKIKMNLEATASRILLYDTSLPYLPNYEATFRGGGTISIKKDDTAMWFTSTLKNTEPSSCVIQSENEAPRTTHKTLFENRKIYLGKKESEDVQKKDSASIQHIAKNTETQFYIDMSIQLGKKMKVKFFTTDYEDESIKATGEGMLRVFYTPSHPIQIKGEYIIKSMSTIPMGYLSVGLNKQQSSRIYWDGDVVPHLDIHTRSEIKNVDFSSLYNLLGQSSSSLNTVSNSPSTLKSDIDLLINLLGTSYTPKIDFDINIPETSSVGNSQNYRMFLNKFRANPEFAKKEVGYLVIFNRFVNDNEQINQSSLSGSRAVAGAMSSLTTYLLNKSLGKELMQKAIDKVLPGMNIQLNINSQFSSSTSTSATTSATTTNDNIIDRGKINVSVSSSFLSDRMTLSVGGAVDYKIDANTPSSSNTLSNNQIVTSPSVDLRWRIIPESNLYVGLYYKNSIGQVAQMLNVFQQGQSNILGANIGVSKEFDSFKELFGKSKNKKSHKKKTPKK